MNSEGQASPDAAGSEPNTLRPLEGEAGVPSVGRARPMRVPRMHMIALVALGLTVAGFTAVHEAAGAKVILLLATTSPDEVRLVNFGEICVDERWTLNSGVNDV